MTPNQLRFIKLLSQVGSEMEKLLEDHGHRSGDYCVVNIELTGNYVSPTGRKYPKYEYKSIGFYEFFKDCKNLIFSTRQKEMLNLILRSGKLYVMSTHHVDRLTKARPHMQLLHRSTFAVNLQTKRKPYTYGYEKNRYK